MSLPNSRQNAFGLELALSGNLDAWANGVGEAIARGLGKATIQQGKASERALEADTEILGPLARGWTHEVYPADGISTSPAVFLWHPQAHIIDAHSRGATISASGARYLWIPIPGSPADRVFRNSTAREAMIRAFGAEQLKLVVTKRGRKMIVAEAVATERRVRRGREQNNKGFGRSGVIEKNRGRGRTDTSYIQATTTVPLFTLVPNVRLEKIMDWRATAEAEKASFTRRVEDQVEQEMKRFEDGLNRRGSRDRLF
jgi:hypothetical protein